MVDNVKMLEHLANGDHNMLQWNTVLRTEVEFVFRNVLDYTNADFDGMRNELAHTVWQGILQPLRVEDC